MPKAGDWKATAEFGDFVFTVDTSGSSIESVKFNFVSLKCDGMTHSGGVELTYNNGQKIVKGAFSIDYDSRDPLSGNGEILTITGTFSSDRQNASGTWEDKLQGAVCASGKWMATPNTTTP
jgi:hypothetical protein